MKWSLKIGRILGIDVYVHFTFLLLLGFVGLSQWLYKQSLEASLVEVIFLAGLFACVLLHEFGHALMARRYGIPTRDITLLPIGGVARLQRMPEKPAQELLVALAGPAVNILIALLLFAGLALRGNWEPAAASPLAGGDLWTRWFGVNILLVLFNLLPAFPMDGGRVLRALLAIRMKYARATRIAATIGQGMAVLFGLAGLFANPFLLLIAVFVWFGAAQEANAAEMKSAATGCAVRRAMLTEFHTLAPTDTVRDALALVLAGSQRDFPVLEGSRLVGVLYHGDLFRALQEGGDFVPVETVMNRGCQTVEADAPLENALATMQAGAGQALPVMSGDRLAGLLTAENIGEFFMMQGALANRRSGPPPIPASPPPLLRGRMTALDRNTAS